MSGNAAWPARPGACFTRAQRLLTGADFKRVFAKAERSADRYWTVLAREHTCQQTRLGLAIAKKVVRNATARNRLKRLARESFRKHGAGTHSADYVVLVRRDAMRASNEELLASLEKHWQRLDKQTARLGA
jgi:ribonuclease P protein component